jgi:RNA polymerase sigma-70 factor (ECF subfamily)
VTADDIARLYRQHGHVVVRRARDLLRSEPEARDVCQEIFTGLLRAPARLDGVTRPIAYLYRATTNHCLNLVRNRARRVRLLRALPPADERAPVGETRAALRELLERLPSELAEVAVYYYLDELSQEEIAAMLGCSRRHVGNLILRLRDAAGDEDTPASRARLRTEEVSG